MKPISIFMTLHLYLIIVCQSKDLLEILDDGSCEVERCKFFSDNACKTENKEISDEVQTTYAKAFTDAWATYIGDCKNQVKGGCSEHKFTLKKYNSSDCSDDKPLDTEVTDLHGC